MTSIGYKVYHVTKVKTYRNTLYASFIIAEKIAMSGRTSNTSRGMTIGLSREERVDQEVKTQKLLDPDGK